MADKKVTTNKTTTVKNNLPTKANITAKPATAVKPVSKATATAAKPVAKTTSNTVAKPSATVKPVSRTTATAAKPVTKTTSNTVAKPSATVKPVSRTTATAAKPVTKTTTATASRTKTAPVPSGTRTATSTPIETSDTKSGYKSSKKVNAVADNTGSEKSGFSALAAKASATASTVIKKVGVRNLAIIGASFVLAICLIIGIVLGARSCSGPRFVPYYKVGAGVETLYDSSQIKSQRPFDSSKAGTTVVGYYAEEIGTVTRVIPESTRDEGLPTGYPTYGSTMNLTVGQKTAIINESSYLCAKSSVNGSGTYDKMDENGFLYVLKNGEYVPARDSFGEPRRLYKHTASVGLYLGNVSDEEQAVIKKISLRARGYSSYSVTGLYAPAGEVIKIQISAADMDATGGITIHIGQALYNGQANNIWAERNINRMPVILNTMDVNKSTAAFDEDNGVYTAYVGSYLGGPIYIRNTTADFTVTISGGVNYRHFVLGYTTEDEFNEYAQSTAPYFDLEVWNYGVLHSGPVNYAKSFSYDDIYDAAILWEKISLVSTQRGNKGIVFLYDPFIAAGAAVAFPGRNTVNCPMGWMTDSLNYKAFVKSGAWGNVHEYNHNFQGYGCGSGADGETTNNALSLVSYSLFTEVSASRQLGSWGGSGLDGWNCYTSAPWALYRVNTNQISSTNGLAVYATLLHNFGQDAFMKSSVGTGVDYFKKWGETVHYNMAYFAKMTKSFYCGSNTNFENDFYNPLMEQGTTNSYPMFVPVSSVYQTGRSYLFDGEKKYIETMQPFMIDVGKPYTVDLSKYIATDDGQYVSGSVVIPDGFSYTIKNVNTTGLIGNASFIKTAAADNDKLYTFTPATNSDGEMRSGKVIVTLAITKDDGAFTVEDVDLVLEFKQSYELNRFKLQRTNYTFTSDTMYTDAVEAYESGYAGFTNSETIANTNPTQNSNTDIWYYPDTTENRNKYPNAPEHYFVHNNTVAEVSGKLGFGSSGKYRIYLRGRLNCALYYSLDGGVTYQLGATIKDGTSSAFRLDDPNTYFDVEFEQNGVMNWVYFKEVLIVQSSPAVSYIGLGFAEWSTPQFTTTEDASGKTHYWDASGNEVSEEEVNNAHIIAPTSANYATAYSLDYVNNNETFTSNYYYNRSNYNFVGIPEPKTDGLTQTYIDGNYVGWNPDSAEFSITNLFDGDPSTYIHSGNGNQYMVSASNPALFTVELSEEITANTLRLYPSNFSDNHRKAFPKNFTIQLSRDGVNYSDAGANTWTGKSAPAEYLDLTLNETYTFKYYKLSVTATSSPTSRLALADIKFMNVLRLTGNGYNYIAPDDIGKFTFRGNWECIQAPSSFGHIYVGQSNATLTFEFTGLRFAIMTLPEYQNGANYTVTVDDVPVSSIDLADGALYSVVDYLTEDLGEGSHTVIIKCTGKFAVDALAFW